MKYPSIAHALVFAAAAAYGGGTAHSAAPPQAPSDQVPSAELRSQVSDPGVRSFYEKRDWQPAWTAQAARQLEQALSNRAAHGLDRIAFTDSTSMPTPAAREARLTAIALAYASALANGVADPDDLYEIYTLPHPEQDLIAGLDAALQNGQVQSWLEGLAPQTTEYRLISQRYQAWRQAAAEGTTNAIAAGDLIRPGDRSDRMPRIAQALVRSGYLSQADAAGNGGSAVYDERLASAVRRLQGDFGIAVDGVVGPNTLDALNTSVRDKARAAAVALERRRWLERDPPATRIDVNIADATLAYMVDGQAVDRRKVIVGQPDWKTPQLQTPMYRLVANPTWTVPKSIENKELSGLSSSQLRSRNMVRRDGWLVQQPGPENALGLVKFDLQNQYAIYLHDTPAKQLFERNRRQLSHGCVRVEGALEFAQRLASDQGIIDEWDQARGTGEETFVKLPRQIPVRLLYFPTHLTPAGEVIVQKDIYQLNGAIAQKLGFAAGPKQVFRPDVHDLGP